MHPHILSHNFSTDYSEPTKTMTLQKNLKKKITGQFTSKPQLHKKAFVSLALHKAHRKHYIDFLEGGDCGLWIYGVRVM